MKLQLAKNSDGTYTLGQNLVQRDNGNPHTWYEYLPEDFDYNSLDFGTFAVLDKDDVSESLQESLRYGGIIYVELKG